MEADAPRARVVSRTAGVLRTLGLDLVGPLVVYKLLRTAGMPEVWSLVLAGCLPALGVFLDWVRWRTLEVVGSVVLGGIALSVVLALVSNDPEVLLLEGSAITAAFGVGCLVSLPLRRPMIFYFAQAFYGGRHSDDGAELDADFDLYSEARSYWHAVTIVWGLTHLAQAAALAAIVQTTSTGNALLFNRTVPWLLNGLLVAWMLWWAGRLQAQKPDPIEDAESATAQRVADPLPADVAPPARRPGVDTGVDGTP